MGREFWGGFQPGRSGRTRRGDIKFLILQTLADGPRHGYDVIVELEKQSGGKYRPSPGSVYPTLQLLEEGGFVSGEALEGKRVFTITGAGRALLASKPAEDAFEDEDGDEIDLRGAAMKLGAAVMQAARACDAPAQLKVREILDRARREIYAILAESD
ncbi:MAG: PadR family transcriptional regulator [Candidatus Baltobacteraceae bacterium]|jgi:DNA-binding PadR family transcriptional regulator